MQNLNFSLVETEKIVFDLQETSSINITIVEEVINITTVEQSLSFPQVVENINVAVEDAQNITVTLDNAIPPPIDAWGNFVTTTTIPVGNRLKVFTESKDIDLSKRIIIDIQSLGVTSLLRSQESLCLMESVQPSHNVYGILGDRIPFTLVDYYEGNMFSIDIVNDYDEDLKVTVKRL